MKVIGGRIHVNVNPKKLENSVNFSAFRKMSFHRSGDFTVPPVWMTNISCLEKIPNQTITAKQSRMANAMLWPAQSTNSRKKRV